MEIPHTVAVVADPDARVPGDHIVLDSEDGAPVVMYPCHLV